jgi:EAL domain-containing protein (putative c-di-GMP-specific phosphodiesterase class I)
MLGNCVAAAVYLLQAAADTYVQGMRPFTERVMRDALDWAGAWAGVPRDVPIAANLSAANLLDSDLPATVDGLLRDAGIAPDRLCVDVTENAVMADTERTVAVLERLRALGGRYSSQATFT